MKRSGGFLVGGFGTIIWLLFWGAVVYHRWDQAAAMGLNEWGDFFAGIVGPVAFLWLVLGYLLQGDDLRLNAAALNLQAEELRNQVAETQRLVEQSELSARASQEMVKLTQEQLTHQLDIQARQDMPSFLFLESHFDGGRGWVRILNQGATISNIHFRCNSSIWKIDSHPVPQLKHEDSLLLHYHFLGKEKFPVNFEIIYNTNRGGRRYSEMCLETADRLSTSKEIQPYPRFLEVDEWEVDEAQAQK